MLSVDLPLVRIGELTEDETFVGVVEGLCAALDQRIASRGPKCANRGCCCKFDSFGHQLFITSVELAYFMARSGAPWLVSSDACPYHQLGRCTVRQARPIGCRIFYCEAVSRDWQTDEMETTLREIKRLHTRFGVPYAYVEWLAALDQLSAGMHPQRVGGL